VCLNPLASFVNTDFMHFLGVHLVSELLQLLFSLSAGGLFLFLLLNVELILVLQIQQLEVLGPATLHNVRLVENSTLVDCLERGPSTAAELAVKTVYHSLVAALLLAVRHQALDIGVVKAYPDLFQVVQSRVEVLMTALLRYRLTVSQHFGTLKGLLKNDGALFDCLSPLTLG
jgi:hypothetical protein